MSKAKFDDDVEKIMNEVEDFDLEAVGEIDHEDIDVDDLLKDMIGAPEDEPTSITDYGDPLNILEPSFSKAPKKEEKPQLDNTRHPLKELEDHERNISSNTTKQASLDSQFIVTNFEKNHKADYSNVQYHVLDHISSYCFPEEMNAISEFESARWGVPKCLAVYPDRYIAIGTSRSMIIIFCREDGQVKKLGGMKEQEYGAVTAMDFSLKEECLISGHESGHIILWKIDRNEMQKTILPVEKSPILSLKFWKDGRGNVIASNALGIVSLYSIQYSFFQWAVERTILIDMSPATRKKKPESADDIYGHLPTGFFEIQILKKDLTRHQSLSKYTVAALVSMKMVIIVTLEPVVSSVFKYMRPEGLQDLTLPSISWGRGPLPEQDGNRYPVLAMSWGKELFLLQCQNVEESEAKGIKFAGFFESKYEIFQVGWLSEGNLLVYDYSREFKVLSTELFNTLQAAKFSQQEFDYTKAIFSSQALDPDISFQIYDLDSFVTEKTPVKNKRPILYYTNTINTNLKNRRVIVLGYKKIYAGIHYEWKEHVEELVEKKEWLPAMAFLITLAKGKNKTFAGLPSRPEERKEVINEFGAEIVKSYINSVHDTHGAPELTNMNKIWRLAVLTVIDFLVSIENYGYLFRDIKRMFENFGLQKIFMDCLELFILRNRIRSIPNEPFRELAKYFTEKEKISVLQYLLVNLEMHDIDLDYAINLCMDYNLLTALFYFCSHRTDTQGADFLTPIVRALSLCQKNINDQNAENNEYGIKFMWFASLTMNGNLFPSGTIPTEIWEDKVKGLIILIFEELNLELMLRVQPYIAFEIFRDLFKPKLSALVTSYPERSVQLLGNQTSPNARSLVDNSIAGEAAGIYEQFYQAVHNKIQAEMLSLIYCCAKKPRKNAGKYQNLMYYMMGDLAVHYETGLPAKVLKETLLFVLDQDKDRPKWEIDSKKISEKDAEDDIDPFQEERSILILGLLRKLEGQLKSDELQMIQKKVDQSEFLDVQAYLIGLKKDYNKCFDLFFNQPLDSQKMKVFHWLENIVQYVQSNQPDELTPLKQAIMSQFRDLAALNGERTRKVIQGLGKSFDLEAITMLEGSPRLQLNYLQGLLALRKVGQTVPDELLVLHIKLLCQLYPKQVLDEVKANSYPLDECLKICKEYKIQNATAFFLERAGKLQEALDIHINLFTKSVDNKLQKIEDAGLFHGENLTKKFQNARELCQGHSEYQDAEAERLWFRLLDKMLEGYLSSVVKNPKVQKGMKNTKDTYMADAYERFAKTYKEYVLKVFSDISGNIAVDSIAKKLEDYKDMKLGELREYLIVMLRAFYAATEVVVRSKKLVLNDIFENRIHVFDMTTKGAGSGQMEMDSDLVDKVIVFECGHSFPKNYIQNNQCYVCKEDSLLRAMEVVENRERQNQKLVSSKESSAVSSSTKLSVSSHQEATGEGTSAGPPLDIREDWKDRHLRKFMIVDREEISADTWQDLEDQGSIFD